MTMYKTVPVPTTPTDLRALLGIARTHCDSGVALQAPVTNAADVFFGDVSNQPGFIPPGSSSDVLPINALDSLYLVGTSGDNIIVMIF